MTTTPFNNPAAFTATERAYIEATTEEFDNSLQRAGIVWPRHEIQDLLCRHFVREKPITNVIPTAPLKPDYGALAETWSDAYRGDHCGREVSKRIIKALFDFGFTSYEAEQIYRSKHLRWFFDSQGDDVAKLKAHGLFTTYLKSNLNSRNNIRAMFKNEFNHDLTNV